MQKIKKEALSKQFKKKQYPVIILKITGEKHNAEILWKQNVKVEDSSPLSKTISVSFYYFKKTSYDVALGRQNINYNQDYLSTYLPSICVWEKSKWPTASTSINMLKNANVKCNWFLCKTLIPFWSH